MEATEVLTQILDHNKEMVEKAIDGLTDKELSRRPTDHCNSIGWLLWHMARAEDGLVSGAQKSPELWTEQGWHEKFGMEPEDSGFQHKSEQLAAFKAPPLDDLKAYWAATEQKARECLKSLRPEDLDRQVPSFIGEGTIPLVTFLNYLVHEVVVHGGQIAYLRGMYKGMGWYY